MTPGIGVSQSPAPFPRTYVLIKANYSLSLTRLNLCTGGSVSRWNASAILLKCNDPSFGTWSVIVSEPRGCIELVILSFLTYVVVFISICPRRSFHECRHWVWLALPSIGPGKLNANCMVTEQLFFSLFSCYRSGMRFQGPRNCGGEWMKEEPYVVGTVSEKGRWVYNVHLLKWVRTQP